jgi:small subunit ribosomal protein S1
MDNERDMAVAEDFLSLEATYSYKQPQRGEIREAVILEIKQREIIVDVGDKRDGIVTSNDLTRLDPAMRDNLKVGQTIYVQVLTPRDADDNLIVSINQGLQHQDWDKAKELNKSEDAVDVTVKGHNRGGILVQWNRLEGFIPSSHLISTSSSGGRDTWDDLISKALRVKVIEVDPTRRRLIFSEREAQREQRALHKQRLLSELKEGDMVRGRVTGLRDFGAFVNLGGADGLIHVSELAWHRVDHPRDVLKVGEEIEVYVLSLDRASNRIALSRKRLLPDPWQAAGEKYHEGQLVEGIVTNVVDFGAFVALDDGLEGLLHLSEMGNGSLKEPYSYVKKSDRLSLRISHLEPEKRRVGFTQRWGAEAAATAETSAEASAEPAEAVQSSAEPDVAAVEPAAENDPVAVKDTPPAEGIAPDAPAPSAEPAESVLKDAAPAEGSEATATDEPSADVDQDAMTMQMPIIKPQQ